MNSVNLVGRLTRDPRSTMTESGMCISKFSIAIDRPRGKDGEDRGADFPSIVVFGKQAENCQKYLAKGRLVAVAGRLTTGSYENREGQKVYTTEVTADRVEFLEYASGDTGSRTNTGRTQNVVEEPAEEFEPSGFAALDGDVPF